MELDVLKSAEAVGLKIGNPVPYNEGKYILEVGTQLNTSIELEFYFLGSKGRIMLIFNLFKAGFGDSFQFFFQY